MTGDDAALERLVEPRRALLVRDVEVAGARIERFSSSL